MFDQIHCMSEYSYNTYIFICTIQNIFFLNRNKTSNIRLYNISLLSNCTKFIKQKDLKPICIMYVQRISNPHVIPKTRK